MGRVKRRNLPILRENLQVFKITAFAAVLSIIVTCSAVSAANLKVDTTAEGGYTSIQAAIDAAKAEDTIFISPGIYVENLKINKEIRLWSDSRSPEDTVIRAANPAKSTVEISVNRVSFSGFGIEGSEVAGISLKGAKNCYVNNNRINGTEYGIFLADSESNTISNNIITLDEKGIRLENSDSNTIQDNIIAYNYDSGISLEKSSKNIIYDNYFKNSKNIEEKAVNSENIWQSPLVTRQNIVKGPYIAGNFWADLEGRGFSETCMDGNSNGICDSSYNITGGGTDKSPLFPKFPNSVKILESRLNSSASVYEQSMAAYEVGTQAGTNASAGNNTTETGTPGEGTPGPGLGITLIAAGTAYLLGRKR
ncbi:MAG TPA: NosD domain-containing protein [Methanosarcina sp.]|nr:NosD domain-containing protein [Methanosarcina sp.]